MFESLASIETEQCVVWPRSKIRDGYGRLRVGKKTIQTHRLAFEKRFGKIPEGLIVCHRCDNPPCMNYQHLFLGTTEDNSNDKVAKKRHGFGSDHPLSKLSSAQIKEIRDSYVFGSSQFGTIALAKKYEVCQKSMFLIVNNRTYREGTEIITPRRRKIPYGSKPGEADVLSRMRGLRDGGITYQQIADSLNDEGLLSRSGSPWSVGSVHKILVR